MPRLDVGSTSIAYQLFGQGEPIVLTAGGWYCRPNYVHFCAGLLSTNHTVLIWDKRAGQGASEVALSDAPSEWYDWADDLHKLLHTLDLAPTYLYGSSGGHVLSLLMAHRYPDDVKGLILCTPPTDDGTLLKSRLSKPRYYDLADLAESKDMQAVIEASTAAWVEEISGRSDPNDPYRLKKWIAETIYLHPENREKILSFDPGIFATTMRRWGDWIASDRFYSAQLSDEDLRKVTVPTTLIPGWDELHPKRSAERLSQLLPNAEWMDLFERYTSSQVEEASGSEMQALLCPIILESIARMEKIASA